MEALVLQENGNEERAPRVAPGQSLKPTATDVFQRLHASHATRVEKLSMMKETADREEAEKLDELKRCTVRTGSSEEAVRIYGRLYQEAELRRQRRERLAHEAEMQLQDALTSQCSSLSSSKSQEPPRWEQLYNSAPLKEKRLGEERQKAQQQEELWLAEHCVHRSVAETQPDQIFQRLYREKFDREKRMEQLRAANAASHSQQLAEGSVHASCSISEADLVERTRRLYEDGLQRIERLEVARRLHNQQLKAPRRSASTGPSRFEMLYSDASRREEERKQLQECHERDELDMCRLQLMTTPRRRAEPPRARSSSARAEASAEPLVVANDAKMSGSRIPRASTPPRQPVPSEASTLQGRSAPPARSQSEGRAATEGAQRNRSISRGSRKDLKGGVEAARTTGERENPDRRGPSISGAAVGKAAEQAASTTHLKTTPRRTATPPRARTPPSAKKAHTPTRVEPKAGSARSKTPPKQAQIPPKREQTPPKRAPTPPKAAGRDGLGGSSRSTPRSAAIRTGAWP